TAMRASRWGIPLATAAMICLGLFVVLQSKQEKPILTVEIAEGAEFREDNELVTLKSGDRLRPGTLFIESPSGAAELRFRDGTLVTLTGDSEVDFAMTSRGKVLRSRSGRLTANVAPQPDGKPMRILTPTAEVEVMGTILSLDTASDATHLTVAEGLVRLRRLADGMAVEVPAQHQSLATLISSSDLSIQKAEELQDKWTMRPQDVTKARKFDGRGSETIYGSVPYVAGRRPDGTKIVRSGISFNGNLARMSPESQIRVRFRSEFGPTLFLSTVRKNGSFGGNFEYNIHRDEASPDSQLWQEVVVPIGKFNVVRRMAHQGFELEKNVLVKVLVSVPEHLDFELAGISVETKERE
ncbi:MAG: FecR family protein, partial [Verrucomicrobiota bacterium]